MKASGRASFLSEHIIVNVQLAWLKTLIDLTIFFPSDATPSAMMLYV
jgi:hypothetical protein